jgi:hypothetical protein
VISTAWLAAATGTADERRAGVGGGGVAPATNQTAMPTKATAKMPERLNVIGIERDGRCGMRMDRPVIGRADEPGATVHRE